MSIPDGTVWTGRYPLSPGTPPREVVVRVRQQGWTSVEFDIEHSYGGAGGAGWWVAPRAPPRGRRGGGGGPPPPRRSPPAASTASSDARALRAGAIGEMM